MGRVSGQRARRARRMLALRIHSSSRNVCTVFPSFMRNVRRGRLSPCGLFARGCRMVLVTAGRRAVAFGRFLFGSVSDGKPPLNVHWVRASPSVSNALFDV